MEGRRRWQFCQLEVNQSGQATLTTFIADQQPSRLELQQNWSGMLGKLGDQGWEMISAFSADKRGPVTYVFKRPL